MKVPITPIALPCLQAVLIPTRGNPKTLTIGIVSSASAPRQDIIGIRLHSSPIFICILPSLESCWIDIGMPVLDNCDFGKAVCDAAHK